jgi:dTDP-4-amino-4,6-dideoxygalactose transaminase
VFAAIAKCTAVHEKEIEMLARSRSYVDVDPIIAHLSSDEGNEPENIHLFEEKFADYMRAPRCIATDQARAALLLALRALHLSPGDEVVVQSFTFWGVVDAILEAGGRPVLVDNNLKDFNATPEEIEKLITKRTRGIIATHLFGIPSDIAEVAGIASDHGVVLIEDCAQCLGGTYQGALTGTFGDLAVVSFNYEKHLSTGEGGMLVINNYNLIEPMEQEAGTCQPASLFQEKCYTYGLLIMHLITQMDSYTPDLSAYFGQNLCREDPATFKLMDHLISKGVSEEELKDALLPVLDKNRKRGPSLYERHPILKPFIRGAIDIRDRLILQPRAPIQSDHMLMNGLRAGVGTNGLTHLDMVNQVRNRHAAVLSAALEGSTTFTTPTISEKKRPTILKYNVLNRTRYPLQEIFKHAHAAGMELSNAQWALPIHQQPAFQRRIRFTPENLKTSAYLSSHIINLPIHYYVQDEEIRTMLEFLEGLTLDSAAEIV